MNTTVLLIGRILLGLLFVPAGFGKLMGAAGFAGYLGSLGVPAPLAMAYIAVSYTHLTLPTTPYV